MRGRLLEQQARDGSSRPPRSLRSYRLTACKLPRALGGSPSRAAHGSPHCRAAAAASARPARHGGAQSLPAVDASPAASARRAAARPIAARCTSSRVSPIAASIRSNSRPHGPTAAPCTRIVAFGQSTSTIRSAFAGPSAPSRTPPPTGVRRFRRRPARRECFDSGGQRLRAVPPPPRRRATGAAGRASQSRGASSTSMSTPASRHQSSVLATAPLPVEMLICPHAVRLESRLTRRSIWKRTDGPDGRCLAAAVRCPSGRAGDGPVSERESMPYDVVIVGAGPAGLSAAIRLKQLATGRSELRSASSKRARRSARTSCRAR